MGYTDTTAHCVAIGAVVLIMCLGCDPRASTESGSTAADGGATQIGGPTATTVPMVTSPKIPTSQQQAQDIVVAYLQKSVNALPKGTVLDSRDFRGGANMSCTDEPVGPRKPPTRFEYWTHIDGPLGADADGLIEDVASAWKALGLRVIERNDFSQPNRFGYAPDGYWMRVSGHRQPGYPLTFIAVSPCFAGEAQRDDVAWPPVIVQQRS